MNAFEGSGSEEQNVPVQQGEEFLSEEPFDASGASQKLSSNQICPMERNTVINCLNNSSDCQWALDMLDQCKRNSTQFGEFIVNSHGKRISQDWN